TARERSYSASPGRISCPRKSSRSFPSDAIWIVCNIEQLTPRPRQLDCEDRRKRASDDLSTGLAEHEADGGDELAIAANDGLIPLHELIGVESKRLRFDLVPTVSEQDVLDFVHLNAKRHVRTSGMTTLIKEKRPPQKAE